MRYLVAEGAVGPDGRRIKCAHCGHQWFEKGEEGLDRALFDKDEDAQVAPIEIDFADNDPEVGQAPETENPVPSRAAPDDFQSILRKEIDADSIPAGVRPTAQDDLVLPPSKGKKTIKIPAVDGGRFAGFAAAGAVFFVFFAIFFAFQPQISRTWPPSNLLYGLIGMHPALPGDGLALTNLQAKFTDGYVVLMGDVTNVETGVKNVPSVLASFIDNHNNILGAVLIAPPAATVDGGNRVSFHVTHESVPDAATAVTFAFSYMKAGATPTGISKEQAGETDSILPDHDGDHLSHGDTAPLDSTPLNDKDAAPADDVAAPSDDPSL